MTISLGCDIFFTVSLPSADSGIRVDVEHMLRSVWRYILNLYNIIWKLYSNKARTN